MLHFAGSCDAKRRCSHDFSGRGDNEGVEKLVSRLGESVDSGLPREYLSIKLKIGVLIKSGANRISGRRISRLMIPESVPVVG